MTIKMVGVVSTTEIEKTRFHPNDVLALTTLTYLSINQLVSLFRFIWIAYLCCGSTTIIYILIISARRFTLDGRLYRRQILKSKVDPRDERVNAGSASQAFVQRYIRPLT